MESALVQARTFSRLDRLVIGVDGSPAADMVLGACAQLPLSAAASILLVHVVRWRRGYSPVAHALVEQHAQKRLAAAAAALDQLLPSAKPRPTIETGLIFGEPFVELVRRARDEHADLLVVGRHGDRTFLDSVLGATAERVLRKGRTPVLVVGNQSHAPYLHPLVALDLSEPCGRAIELALRLVTPGSTCDVVHVRDPDDDEVGVADAARTFLGRYEVAASLWNLVIRDGDPRRVLLEEIRARGSDLVVLGTHGRTALAQVLIGSVAEALVRMAPCDILVARPSAHAFSLP